MKRVAIVGAGPVGLFLAALLARSGREVLVLDKRLGRASTSRSIGLHPPALEALAAAGMAEPLLTAGVRISRAQVFLGRRRAGTLSLAGCPPPFPFVLSLPQPTTEALLEEGLQGLAVSLRRGCEVESVLAERHGARLQLVDGTELSADFVVGCDGRASQVRRSLGVEWRGRAHGDHYLMADLADTSDLDSDAAIFLSRGGVVESFPLPTGRRRWVARVEARPAFPSLRTLAEHVQVRTGFTLPTGGEQVATAFTAETRLAGVLAGPRWALAGDAAHVVSPIGGQGMNLGLLGALALAEALPADAGEWQAESYGVVQRARARAAGRRARLNMLIGRGGLAPAVRALVVRALLSAPAKARAGRYFTMRGL